MIIDKINPTDWFRQNIGSSGSDRDKFRCRKIEVLRCNGILPFTHEQYYNEAIKEVFTLAGVTRIVTVLNPLTREEEKRPINEVASSHLARRTFIGNIYKKVKDPNLVGALSGHKERSKAFNRYREIDEEMKRELVDLLK